MTLKDCDKIWIHRDEESNDLRICGEWMGGIKVFNVDETTKLFECVKDAIQAKFPHITVNPWSDATHGTLD